MENEKDKYADLMISIRKIVRAVNLDLRLKIKLEGVNIELV